MQQNLWSWLKSWWSSQHWGLGAWASWCSEGTCGLGEVRASSDASRLQFASLSSNSVLRPHSRRWYQTSCPIWTQGGGCLPCAFYGVLPYLREVWWPVSHPVPLTGNLFRLADAVVTLVWPVSIFYPDQHSHSLGQPWPRRKLGHPTGEIQRWLSSEAFYHSQIQEWGHRVLHQQGEGRVRALPLWGPMAHPPGLPWSIVGWVLERKHVHSEELFCMILVSTFRFILEWQL
jgi:hypothetical protein